MLLRCDLCIQNNNCCTEVLWAARYKTWLLIKLTPKGPAPPFSSLLSFSSFYSFLFFSFLFFSFPFLSFPLFSFPVVSQRCCSTYLIQTKPLCGWLPASCHQDIVNAIQSNFLVLVVLGCHGQLPILLLDHLDRGEVRLQLNALPLELALCVLCCLWVKSCTTHSFI